MSLVDGMLDQLKVRGLRVEYVSDDQLKLVGPKSEATPELMAALKVFKKDLIERLRPRDGSLPRSDVHHAPAPATPADDFENCRECNGTIWDAEETADICEMKRCPYKRRGR
jgi:hypothetical protein